MRHNLPARARRLAAIALAIAVLAAGCSQSEDGVSDGSGSATSTSGTSLVTVTLRSLGAESTAARSSLAARDTTTSLAPGVVSGSASETATTTTTTVAVSVPSVEAKAGVVLSEEVLESIDVAVGACGDLYDLGCGAAVRDVCFQLRSGGGFEQPAGSSGGGVVLAEDDRFDVCVLDSLVHSWEVDAVLSARYGEEYYRWNPGFLAFRDPFHSGARGFFESRPDIFAQDKYYDWLYPYSSKEVIGSFGEFVDDSAWAEYLPDAVRLKLLRIFYDFGLVLQSDTVTLSPPSEDIASRILGAPDFPEAYRECYGYGLNGSIKVSLAEMLTSESDNIGDVLECINNLCASSEDTDAVVCHYEDIEGDEFSESGFYWHSIKYFCAEGAVDDNAFPDDTCHRVAANICEIPGVADSLNILASWHLIEGSAACRLGSALYFQPYNDAKAECYSDIENILTTMNLLLAQDISCNDASEECTKFWRDRRYVRNYYPLVRCPEYRQYYALETFWQKIPLICEKDNTSPLAFVDSECYNSIRRFCDSHYGRASFGDFSIYHISPIRGGDRLHYFLCNKIINTGIQISARRNSSYDHLNFVPHESQKILASFVDRTVPWVLTNAGELPYSSTDSIDSINSAVKECTNTSIASSEPECVIALWKSCFDLLSYKTSSKIPHFDGYYFFARGSRWIGFSEDLKYVCDAAWIAELTRMTTILASSFRQDHQAGNFNKLTQYIADEAFDTGEGIITFDENGKPRPNLNPENLNPETAEALTALGTSIAQLFQPYLPTPNTPYLSNTNTTA